MVVAFQPTNGAFQPTPAFQTGDVALNPAQTETVSTNITSQTVPTSDKSQTVSTPISEQTIKMSA